MVSMFVNDNSKLKLAPLERRDLAVVQPVDHADEASHRRAGGAHQHGLALQQVGHHLVLPHRAHALDRVAERLALRPRHRQHRAAPVLPPPVAAVERRVVRIVTPGTLHDEALLDARRDNVLVAVAPGKAGWGLAWLELSSGRFNVLEVESEAEMLAELTRLSPAELLVPESLTLPDAWSQKRSLRRQGEWLFDLESATRSLCDQFEVSDLRGFGCAHLSTALIAAGKRSQVKTPPAKRPRMSATASIQPVWKMDV